MKVRITAEFNVIDEKSLLRFVRDQYRACWFDNDWKPKNIAEAVLEAVINSNLNPGNDEIGLEITRYDEACIDDEARAFQIPDLDALGEEDPS